MGFRAHRPLDQRGDSAAKATPERPRRVARNERRCRTIPALHCDCGHGHSEQSVADAPFAAAGATAGRRASDTPSLMALLKAWPEGRERAGKGEGSAFDATQGLPIGEPWQSSCAAQARASAGLAGTGIGPEPDESCRSILGGCDHQPCPCGGSRAEPADGGRSLDPRRRQRPSPRCSNDAAHCCVNTWSPFRRPGRCSVRAAIRQVRPAAAGRRLLPHPYRSIGPCRAAKGQEGRAAVALAA